MNQKAPRRPKSKVPPIRTAGPRPGEHSTLGLPKPAAKRTAKPGSLRSIPSRQSLVTTVFYDPNGRLYEANGAAKLPAPIHAGCMTLHFDAGGRVTITLYHSAWQPLQLAGRAPGSAAGISNGPALRSLVTNPELGTAPLGDLITTCTYDAPREVAVQRGSPRKRAKRNKTPAKRHKKAAAG
jgi:hypothetical protein